MSNTHASSGTSAGGCCASCKGSSPSKGTDARREGWGRVLDRLWPKGAPFPPAAPWAGAVVRRRNLQEVVNNLPHRLPTLPRPGLGDEDHSDNLAAIADFLTLSVPERHSDVVVMSICGGDKGGGESFEHPYGGVGDGSCEGATVGDVCVRFSDAEGAEFYDSGPCPKNGTGCITQGSDCSYNILSCGCDDVNGTGCG